MICDSYIFAVFLPFLLIKLALFTKYPQMLTVFNAPSLCLKSWLGKLIFPNTTSARARLKIRQFVSDGREFSIN